MFLRAALMAHIAPPAGAVVLMAAPTVEELEAELQEIIESSEAIAARVNDESREFTDEEIATIEGNSEKAEKLKKQIKARKLVAPQASTGRRSTPEPTNEPGRRSVPAQPRSPDAGRMGFQSFGEFAMSVARADGRRGQVDPRLMAAATTFATEGTGSEGGWLVPPDFSTTIWQKVMDQENLLARCTPLQTGGNSMTIPKDETTPWQSSGGIQVYWEGEGASIPPSKPAFEQSTFRLVKLTGLVPVSDELLEDAVGIESYLRAKAPQKMAAKINTAIVSGNGVGMPLGILSAPSLITVAAEAGQAADSVLYANIVNMWSRMYAPWRRNGIWIINQDVEPQLDMMAFDPAATAGKVPVYLPAGGASAAPYASLKGRPVVPIEACSTIGDVGDVMFVDFAQYWALTKAQGIRTDTSIHLYFDQALTTFRFIFRLNGMPAWSSVIQPQNGNLTRSWAVALATRP